MAGGGIGTLINKETLASTPKQVFNARVFLLSALISFSGGLHGANTSNISGIISMKDFIKTYGLSSMTAQEKSNATGWMTSVIVLGGLVGSLTSAPFNDRLGRKWTLVLNSFIYIFGTFLQMFAVNVNMIIGGRAVQGFASGTGTVTGTLYLAEIAPKAIRGVLGAFFSTNIMLGVSLGYWVNYISILHISPHSHWQWRTPILFQLYPAIAIIAFLPFTGESPRWLLMRGKQEKAIRVLSHIRNLPQDHPYLLEEYDDIVHSIRAEQEMGSSTWKGLLLDLKADRTLLRRFILVCIIQIGFNFSGGNSITYYQTSILTTINATTTDGAYLFSGIYGLLKVVAVLIYAFLLSERFGRRRMLLTGGIINVACVLWIAIYLGALSGKSTAAGWVAIASVCIFAIGYGIGWAPVAFGLNGEVFPNRLRAKMMSLTLALNYAANLALTRSFPNMVANMGAFGPFAIFAVVSSVILVYLFFAMPETKGRSIDHMAVLFGGHWFVNGIKQKQLPSPSDAELGDGDDGTKIELKEETSHLENEPKS